ncbi:hypothetical protein PL9214290835 [Planktothrix tepida PCC 9214]|uniref:Uncharacterized protein n=1 Tax=Planktothrix tepida PCC 9214 TaxID=671072 RepID=A0A1J1LH81_9CYAN|nr:hypothetical protein PL9214290835 [Planktothrix tepida PCC 9214]
MKGSLRFENEMQSMNDWTSAVDLTSKKCLAQQILTISYPERLLLLKKTSKLIGFFTECKREGKLNKEYTQRLILSTDVVYGFKPLSGFLVS